MSAQDRDDDIGYGTRWLRSNGKEVSENGSRVAELVNWWLSGIYHAQADVLRADWSRDYVELVTYANGLSTFDFSGLTRLVIGAHDAAIRVEISPCNPKYLRLRFHPRKRNADRSPDRHPTIIDAIRMLGNGRLPSHVDAQPIEAVS